MGRQKVPVLCLIHYNRFMINLRDRRTLRNYRRMIINKGLDEVLFRGLTDRLIEAFGVEVKKQRLDSTSARSAMRSLSRLGIFVEGLAKFLRELKRTHPRLYKKADEKIIGRYVIRKDAGCFDFSKPSDSKRRLPEAALDIWKQICLFETCQSQHLCPTQIRNGDARLQYTHDRLRQCRRRLARDSDEFRDRYRWRAGIEATMSRLKYQVGLARLRVRGMAAVQCAVFLRALGLNIFRCAAALRAG
jgi:hypothetical protein